jgi:hypothetical protein
MSDTKPQTADGKVRLVMDGHRIVDVNGVDLCVDTIGDAADPAILLISGFEVPLPDWAERAAVIDYLAGYERRLEATEYFDEAHVRALVDRTTDLAASVMNHALAEEGELARGRARGRSRKPQFSIFSASCAPAAGPLAGLPRPACPRAPGLAPPAAGAHAVTPAAMTATVVSETIRILSRMPLPSP